MDAVTLGAAARPRIGVLDDDLRLAAGLADWSAVTARADLVFLARHVSLDEAPHALPGFDALCTLRERLPFPAELFAALPRLRYLCVTGKRTDTIDLAAAAARGVLVSNTPVAGKGAGAVTELTWALILAAARDIPGQSRSMREGGWQTRAGTGLRGKRLGVVGLGGIGAEVARIGAAFGMEVVAWSPHMTAERAALTGARAVARHDLFSGCDVITLHLALAGSTRGVVGRAELAAMKPSAWLVNTARAGLVDGEALIAALLARRIGGAALDVYDPEPLPAGHVLRTLDNVVTTPHLGYVTHEMLASYYGYAAENLAAWLEDRPIRLVHPSD